MIVGVGGLDFETLLLRIHPAASRVKLLSAQAPASFVAWDLLARGDNDLRNKLAVRHERLEHVLAGAAPPVHLYHRLRAIERLRRTGSAASRAPGSMVSWQSVSTRPIAPGSAFPGLPSGTYLRYGSGPPPRRYHPHHAGIAPSMR